MYQLGVFVSRSSVFVVHITWFWVLAVLQVRILVNSNLNSVYTI